MSCLWEVLAAVNATTLIIYGLINLGYCYQRDLRIKNLESLERMPLDNEVHAHNLKNQIRWDKEKLIEAKK